MSSAQLRALIYNRVSSDPTGQRVSVESQEVENRAWCQREGWKIVGVITDNDRSATRYATKQREGYAQVRDALTGNHFGRVDILVCWESSRATRSLDDHTELRLLCATHDVRFAYRGRVYDLTDGDDRFSAGLDALLDEREAERLRARALRGNRSAAAKGRPHGTVPYGYMRTYHAITGELTKQVPDPATAPVVAEVVARVIGGDTLHSIAADLTGRKVPTPQEIKQRRAHPKVAWTGEGWTSSKLRRLLGSRAMTGVRAHRGHAHAEATWEPIVSAADWEKVQAILADPGRAVHHRGVAVKHLLSGIATCGVCGAWMRPLTNQRIPSYACAGKGPGTPKAHVVRAREPMDALATGAVCAWARRPDALQLLAAHDKGSTTTSAARRELADLEARLAQFEAAAIAGALTAESFGRIEAGLLVQIEQVRRASASPTVPPSVVALASSPDVDASWAKLGVTEGGLITRREVVRALLEVVVYPVRGRRGMRGFDRSAVSVDYRIKESGQDVARS